MKINRVSVVLTLIVLWAVPGVAQFESPEKSRYELSVFGWFAATEGAAALGEFGGGVDSGFFDSVENPDLGGGVYLRAKRAKFGWIIGAEYLDSTNDESSEVTLEAKSIVAEFDLTYEVAPGVDFLIGARFIDADPTVILTPTFGPRARATGSDSWVDPIVGLRYEYPFSPRWGFLLRADVGGFGLVSDVTWQLAPTFGFRASDGARVVFGYRVFDVEYDDGVGVDRFLYDVQQRGLFAGVTLGWGGGPKN